MDEELETLVVKVRADTRDFAAGVERMQGLVEGPLATGMERAGQRMESALSRFVRTGTFGFEDLRRVALGVIDDIVRAQMRTATGAGGGGGLGSLLGLGLGALLGLPGRATGGPVAPGQAYMVGERGPELFVPTASGRVEAGTQVASRNVSITVNVAKSAAEPALMQRSARQVARAVRRGIESA